MDKDVWGKALYGRWKEDPEPFYFIYQGIKEVKELDRYFRPYERLTNIERDLISMAKGNILDIGCATGYYIPALMKYGYTQCIEKSPLAVKICEERGIETCINGDIFSFHTGSTYDTITFFENNLGLGGSVGKVYELLSIAKNLVKPDGEILIHQQDNLQDTFKTEITMEYKGEQDIVPWIHMNMRFVKQLCDELNLDFEFLDRGDNRMYLAKITRKGAESSNVIQVT